MNVGKKWAYAAGHKSNELFPTSQTEISCPSMCQKQLGALRPPLTVSLARGSVNDIIVHSRVQDLETLAGRFRAIRFFFKVNE